MNTFTRVTIVAIFSAVFANFASANDRTKDVSGFTACEPATVDGTQVFEGMWIDGNCFGNPKVVVRITDFVLEMTCSIPAKECVQLKDMNSEQLRHYTDLRRIKPTYATHSCPQTDGKTWRSEMITGERINCMPAVHTARYYDLVLNRGCVMFGSLSVGCIKLPPHFREIVRR